MLYLLYGPDTYRSRRKLNEIIEEYRKKTGANFQVHQFDADEDDPARVRAAAESGSLFSAKRLVVLRYPFSGKADFEPFAELAKRSAKSKEVFLIFWDREITKSASEKLAKAMPYAEKEQEFLLLEGRALESWIVSEASRRSISLSCEDKERFLSYGGDLWRTVNELDKFAVAASQAPYRKNVSSSVFSLGDTFFTSKKEGLFHILNLLRAGEDALGLFAYLANHARTLAAVRLFSEKRIPVPQSFRIHPFVQKKAAVVARNMAGESFHGLFRLLWEEDRKIKTGERTPEHSLERILMRK